MAQMNESLTKSVAHLARLELTEEEIRLFTTQLGQVIGYVELLQEVKLGSGDQAIEPLTHPLELKTPLREDVVRPSPVDSEGQPKTLAPAPDVLDGGFKVPPIV
jgi:aspartyl-tRNA(Asn)/glutamyl-tRNA(Gln) amidotransferase subunit C